jgi:DNA-binding response OmpR family regulator
VTAPATVWVVETGAPSAVEPNRAMAAPVSAAIALRERTGDTVSRLELLGAIWGYEDELGSDVVDAVIHTLRRKLGSHADMIQTVRGVGYRLSR